MIHSSTPLRMQADWLWPSISSPSFTYRDEEEAIRLANASDYGLHAYVFSSNVTRANAVAARLEAGRVMVNILQNDALAPFGGYKRSGFGREFGLLDLESFLEPKAIIGNNQPLP